MKTVLVNVDTEVDGPEINKNVYGQFAEHLGRGIYEGLWVGPESEIPNVRGWRVDVIDALRDLQVPVIRWPGGCFADQYHWQDGIGPRDERPVKVNTLWGGVEETNAVGTHEFFDLVEQLGADAYVNGNIGTGTPQEMADWLEYLTSDTQSDLANLRRANGRDEPFELPFFGVGNECWGCGGHMEPEYYTSLYKHWGTFLRTPWDKRPKFVASGGHGADEKDHTRWTEYLTANIEPNFLLGFDAVSFHYYTHPEGDIYASKGASTRFGEAHWASTISRTLEMNGFIEANKEVLERNDPANNISFYIDEWGTWYDTDDEENPGFLYQQNSLRDAVVAALNFNIFHKHADRVGMTNIAQMVNVLQAMVLTEGDQMLLTPTYHAFKMFVPFQGARSLPVTVNQNVDYRHGAISVPAVSSSAARTTNGALLVSLVNVDPRYAQTIDVVLSGSDCKTVSGQILTAKECDAHNTFAAPDTVTPTAFGCGINNDTVSLDLPSKSVVVLEIR